MDTTFCDSILVENSNCDMIIIWFQLRQLLCNLARKFCSFNAIIVMAQQSQLDPVLIEVLLENEALTPLFKSFETGNGQDMVFFQNF